MMTLFISSMRCVPWRKCPTVIGKGAEPMRIVLGYPDTPAPSRPYQDTQASSRSYADTRADMQARTRWAPSSLGGAHVER